MNHETTTAEPAKRRCRICALLEFDVEEYTQEAIERLLKLKPKEACPPGLFAERIGICDTCSHQDTSGVCMMCGCYCTVRACLSTQHCPRKKW